MDLDVIDMKYITDMLENLNRQAGNGYNISNADAWRGSDFLGRIDYNVNKDETYTFRPKSDF